MNTWIIYLEAAVALSVLLLIVWATWPKHDNAKRTATPPETTAAKGERDEQR